jgi:hypothetical protein
MMPSLMGPVAGKIFDAGGFYAVEAVGGLIFTFSCVSFLLFLKAFADLQTFTSEPKGSSCSRSASQTSTIRCASLQFPASPRNDRLAADLPRVRPSPWVYF